jgi:hypothetical protein
MNSCATPAPHDEVQPALPAGRFSGRSEFTELVLGAFTAAAAQGWHEMIWCDDDFDDWPLGERAVIASLQGWARNGRKLTLLARHYDGIVRRHARFVSWRQIFSHLIDCRVSLSKPGDPLPSALWSPHWVFERLDLTHSAGMAGAEPVRRVALKERLGELLLHSSPAFPATTLGL